jgi:hypothetical protein
MAYPGTNSVASKDIRDVAESLLNPNFVNDAVNLSLVIKSSRPKMVKGNFLGSKIVGLTLEPLTQSINKNGKVNTNRM